jgi:tetratricopeptide (TPR) repeat protein
LRFFERFRGELKRYADGVHELGAPATENELAAVEKRLGRALSEAWRDLLLQWNGGWLFHDDYALFSVGGRAELDRIAPLPEEPGLLAFGTAPAASLWVDGRGRVISVDESTGTRAVEGSDVQRWVDATMAREGLLYDREGEFREEAFDGVELTPKVARKRAETAVKADPASPAWREELGRICLEVGQDERAAECFEKAVELEPETAPAWFALAKLQRAAGRIEEARDGFARAGQHERDPSEAAFAFANAARCAREGGSAGADELAAKVVAAYPTFVAEQRAAAEHLAGEGDLEGAIERLGLAAAVAPDDPEVKQALSHTRARSALRPV